MRWRLVRIVDAEANDHDLTAAELEAIGAMLSLYFHLYCTMPLDERNTAWRGLQKIQPEMDCALEEMLR